MKRPQTLSRFLKCVLTATLKIYFAATSAQAQWQIQPAPTTADLRGIYAVSPQIAWASGTNGTVLRTLNGGKDWQPCAIPPAAEQLDFRGIQAFDATTAIVMSSGKGDLSRLYKTTDGCQTWTLVFTNPDKEGFWDTLNISYNSPQDPSRGCFAMILGDPVNGSFALFVSLDCGQTWERQHSLPNALPNESAFAASNSVLLGSVFQRRFVTGGSSGARVWDFMTYVDFTAPERQHPINQPPYQINSWFPHHLSCKIASETSGAFSLGEVDRSGEAVDVIVGGDYKTPDKRTCTAWYYQDSAYPVGFMPAATPPHGFRSAVAYSPTTKTWITVGPNGTDISTDDGRNWLPLFPGPFDAPNSDQHWNALSLPFVVGPHGRIGILRPESLASGIKRPKP